MDLCRPCMFYGVALCLCSASALAENALPSTDQLDYQERLLLHPTTKQLAAEQDGRVRIYDSLEIGLINTALDQQFNRIDHMMFSRIHHPPPSGAGPAAVEDDGCDD